MLSRRRALGDDKRTGHTLDPGYEDYQYMRQHGIIKAPRFLSSSRSLARPHYSLLLVNRYASCMSTKGISGHQDRLRAHRGRCSTLIPDKNCTMRGP